VLPQLLSACAEQPCVVLQAPPGAGKTTRVPLALLEQDWLQGTIIVIQPRRLAVYSAARRLAAQLGERLEGQQGPQVGYRTRYDRCVSQHTRIEVVTDGIFLARIQRDPELQGVAMVLFDEFHERSVNVDLGLAFALETQQVLRDAANPLRLLVMSATLDGDRLSQWLQAPLIESHGRSFPVETHYRPQPRDRYPDQHIAAVISQALQQESGSLLVFLPGMGEIRAVQRRLEEQGLPPGVEVCPLHASLPREQQQAALVPAPAGQRKVVLSTNVAETSITIEDVRVVVDSGQARVARYDERRGLNALHTEMISAASAEQRRGRAGRTQPGVCFRLWAESRQASLKPFNDPEILTTDLQPIALELAQWGVHKLQDLTLLDYPPVERLQRARKALRQLGALSEDHSITAFGRRLGTLGLPPRLAALVLACQGTTAQDEAIRCVAILSEGDPMSRGAGPLPADIQLRLAQLETSAVKTESAVVKRLRSLCQQIQQRLQHSATAEANSNNSKTTFNLPQALARAFPDRIARQREAGSLRYLLSNGKGAQLHKDDKLAAHPLLVVLDAGGSGSDASIQLACPITLPELQLALPELIVEQAQLSWDDDRQAVSGQQQLQLGPLVLQQHPLPKPWRAELAEQASQLLLQQLQARELAPLPWKHDCEQFCQRINWLAQQQSHKQQSQKQEQPWPDFSRRALSADAGEWLQPFLQQRTSLRELDDLNLLDALHNRLGWDRLAALEQQAPTHWQLATGQHPLYYDTGTPTLKVRLQECYGLQIHPTLPGGEAITLELLSPARRPLQITRNLQAFWQGSYREVAKEMRGRYPKHFWPDDPATSHATTRTKKHM